jgi:hypothetical protein
VYPFGGGSYKNQDPEVVSITDNNKINDHSDNWYDNLTLSYWRDCAQKQCQHDSLGNMEKNVSLDEHVDRNSNMEGSDLGACMNNKPVVPVCFSPASRQSSHDDSGKTMEDTEQEVLVPPMQTCKNFSLALTMQSHSNKELLTLHSTPQAEATPLLSGLPSPPNSPGPAILENCQGLASTLALQDALQQIQELKQVLLSQFSWAPVWPLTPVHILDSNQSHFFPPSLLRHNATQARALM